MTAAKVVDASALAAFLFDEPAGAIVLERLSGGRLVAPALLAFELTNTCLKKCRREPDRRNKLIASLRLMEGLGIEEVRVEQEAALALALETNLSAYDACYLRLALDLDAELVTFDDALERAWRARTSARP